MNILCLCLFTPFGLTAAGWLNPLFSGTIALTYGGLLIITRELSQPFRCEPRHRGINLRATAQALARDWVGGANSTLLAKLVRREHARRSSPRLDATQHGTRVEARNTPSIQKKKVCLKCNKD